VRAGSHARTVDGIATCMIAIPALMTTVMP
jgi:hypothetical protein